MPKPVRLLLSLSLLASCKPGTQPGPTGGEDAARGDAPPPVLPGGAEPPGAALGTPDPTRRMTADKAPLALHPETDARLDLPPTGGVGGQGITTLADVAPLHLIRLLGGEFTRGSPEDEVGRYPNSNESPRQRLKVESFAIGETEITQLQWASVMGGNPLGPSFHPITSVSWCDCLHFANKLSQREGLQPVYDIPPTCEQGTEVKWNRELDGYRLPTEAEWEYAARAGTQTRFWSGNNEGDVFTGDWLEGNSGGIHAVKERKPNPWGLYDIHGNVSEWVFDLYHTYPTAADGSTPGEGAVARVWRGGNWSASPQRSRSAFRNRREPGYQFDALGCRIAR